MYDHENVDLPLPDGAHWTGEVVRPPDADRLPGLIVLHEVFGITPEIREVAQRFAARGYVVLVPDLFSAGARIGCMAKAMIESSRARPGRTTARIEAARSWLAERSEVDANRMAVIGFCLGGGFALTYGATEAPGVRAVSANYAQVPRDAEAMRNSCPVVASYGKRDLVYGRQAERLARVLTAYGVTNDVRTYREAGHSFLTNGRHPIGRLAFLPLRIGHSPEAAINAWERIFNFLDRHLAIDQTDRGKNAHPIDYGPSE